LSRYEIVDIMYKDTFEEVAKGKLRSTLSRVRSKLMVRLDGEIDWRSGSSDWTPQVQGLQDHRLASTSIIEERS
jgi:hypothetical protein